MPMTKRFFIFTLFLFFATVPYLHAGERVYGLQEQVSVTDRTRLAQSIMFHDFENRRDPDTGIPLPESADLDRDGWPDFWEPIRAVGFPEYLINTISIVPDRSPFLSGAYRDADNHVLHMSFDGSRVGVRTRAPVVVDPNLSYEFSLRERDENIEGGVIRAGIEWMRVDDAATQYLRQDEIPHFLPGQTDWAVNPRKLLVSDPPPQANAARLFIILESDDEAIAISRHGNIWFDDVRLKALPRVVMASVDQVPGADTAVDVFYSGLIDNVPDPNNPGFFRGKRYSRRIVITDVLNQPIGRADVVPRPLTIDAHNKSEERIVIPSGKFGVYYINLRIFDADNLLIADTTRSLAITKPTRQVVGLDAKSEKPVFGIIAGAPPTATLQSPAFLRTALETLGVRQVKITPWLDNYNRDRDGNTYYNLLADEIRRLRPAGIKVTGVVAPPSELFDGANLATAVTEYPDTFETLLMEAGNRMGMYMDGWQWGKDADNSIAQLDPMGTFGRFLETLAQFAGGLPLTWNIRLDSQGFTRFPENFGIISGFSSEREPPAKVWFDAAKFFPWLYSQFQLARGPTYPPPALTALSPPPPADPIEAKERERNQRGVWLTLPAQRIFSQEPDSAEERSQLEQMMRRAIYASILSPEIVFLGELYDPNRGLLRLNNSSGKPSISTMARPVFLAARVIGDMLEGATYLGPLGLLKPYEAHVFRRSGSDQAVIALWHNEAGGVRNLARVEIANGPPLSMVDWAGNSEPLPAAIPVSRTPMFITGLNASLALTRMSVRVGPNPPVMAINRPQTQVLEVVNHLVMQAPLLFRLKYAAREADGAMENGWTVTPEELRANLAPVTANFAPYRLRYTASPDPNSPVQKVDRSGSDKTAEKLAQVRMTVNASPPADMMLYLKFPLKTDLDVDVVELQRSDDPHFVTLQLKIRWFPTASNRRRNEISLRPFFLRKGEMKEAAPLPVTVRALPQEERGRPDARYETVELRIPKNPPRQTWVGLEEDGGSSFYLADVTGFLSQ